MSQAVVIASREFVGMSDLRPLRVLDIIETRDGFARDECALLISAPDGFDGKWLNPVIRGDGSNFQVEDWRIQST